MSATSLSLLDRLRHGPDTTVWERFAGIYCPLLRQWALRLGVQPVDADDLVQEVLTVVMREMPQFEHSGRTGAFRAWLRQVLVHRTRDFWRSRNHRPQATGATAFAERLEQLADDASGLSAAWNREHDEYVLKQLLESISTRFDARTWQAFRRQVIDQVRADAVAAELGMSLSAVYVAKSRILAALRQEAGGLVEGP